MKESDRKGRDILGTAMNRRAVLKMGALAAAGLSGLGMLSCSSKNDLVAFDFDGDVYEVKERGAARPEEVIRKTAGFRGKRPNIIVILCDDMGYGDLGCYGSKSIKTPNLDRLAREGVRFTDFYACNALCSPSRAGLLTGRYPHRTGVTFPIFPKDESPLVWLTRAFGKLIARLGAVDLAGAQSIADGLPSSEITLARALKIAGYRTAVFGKWHLGDFPKQPQYHPMRHGFDYFAGFPAANDDWPVSFWRGEKQVVSDIGLDQEEYTGMLTREAIDFIEKSGGKPFFLYLAHKDPHQPCFPSKAFQGSSRAGSHGDVVQEVDWSLGEIMKCLRRNALDGNTVVLFTSDNGPWFNGSPGMLRGRKGQSFEGGLRVPFIAWWPGRITAGRVCGEPCMNIDFFPTLLSMAGLTLPSDRVIDGRNIGGLLDGSEKQSPHDMLFFFHMNELEGVRSGRWKYFRNINQYVFPVPNDKTSTMVGTLSQGGYAYESKGEGKKKKSVSILSSLPLLYDLELDPGESYNVVDQYPGVAQKMEKMMTRWEREFVKNPRGWTGRR